MKHWLSYALSDWRQKEYWVMVLAIVVAVSAVTSIRYISDRVDIGMQEYAADLLGADMVLESSRPLEIQQWLDTNVNTAKLTQSVETMSMVAAADGFVLASVKSVGEHYPLRGALKIRSELNAPTQLAPSIPPQGEVWVEPRVLKQLDLAMGDELEVGYSKLTITAIVASEPDRTAGFFSFAPRVLINELDMPETKLLAPGSRAKFRYFFNANIQENQYLHELIDPQLTSHEKWLDVKNARPEFGRTMTNAERYLLCITILIWGLAGVTLYLASERFYRQHHMHSAWLRCLGVSPSMLLLYYSSKLVILALASGLVGSVFGWAIHLYAASWLEKMMQVTLPDAGIMPMVTGIIASVMLLLGFVLPKMARLAKLPPNTVIRGAGQQQSTRFDLNWLISWAALGVFASLLLEELQIAMLLTFVLPVVLVSLYLVLLLAFKLLARIFTRSGYLTKTALMLINRQAGLSAVQCVGFVITFTALGVAYAVRSDLIEQWQAQIPENAPNHFALNIMPEQQESFSEFVSNSSDDLPALYPVVRGRLIKMNDELAAPGVADQAKTDESLRRELNLTWATEHNRVEEVVSGDRFTAEHYGKAVVSMETDLAKRLGITLGDTLTFDVGDNEFTVTVINTREVDWASFRPNFYFIFAPGFIETLPHTYMTSFHLADNTDETVISMVESFPNVSILPVGNIIEQVKSIVTQVTRIIEVMLVFVGISSVLILISAVWLTLDQRHQFTILMRTFGAKLETLRGVFRREFLVLGVVSAGVALVVVQGVVALLYVKVFKIEFVFNLPAALVFSAVTVGLIGLTGAIAMRSSLQKPTCRRDSSVATTISN